MGPPSASHEVDRCRDGAERKDPGGDEEERGAAYRSRKRKWLSAVALVSNNVARPILSNARATKKSKSKKRRRRDCTQLNGAVPTMDTSTPRASARGPQQCFRCRCFAVAAFASAAPNCVAFSPSHSGAAAVNTGRALC
ncbi:hypothetical protein MTO96_041094 [Rhipicephalus appendiculatus]